jgi:hypothetical protein
LGKNTIASNIQFSSLSEYQKEFKYGTTNTKSDGSVENYIQDNGNIFFKFSVLMYANYSNSEDGLIEIDKIISQSKFE